MRRKSNPMRIFSIFSLAQILMLLSLSVSRLILITFPLHSLLRGLLAICVHHKREEE